MLLAAYLPTHLLAYLQLFLADLVKPDKISVAKWQTYSNFEKNMLKCTKNNKKFMKYITYNAKKRNDFSRTFTNTFPSPHSPPSPSP